MGFTALRHHLAARFILSLMGAYGRSRAHQLLFGSCTETFFRHADKPILLMH
jgi:nucleotide-binding universal stress UspA family protein